MENFVLILPLNCNFILKETQRAKKGQNKKGDE